MVIYILDPSRSAQVIKEPFGENSQGILSVDRYSAYKAMAKVLDIILAFCWAHVRRDFSDDSENLSKALTLVEPRIYLMKMLI